MRPVGRALLSVHTKTGLVELARELAAAGVELVASGGTRRALTAAGLAVRDVAELTGFPPAFGGRVKTLHPAVHGALLFRREDPEQEGEARRLGIVPIDLVVVNLYPFTAARRDGVPEAELLEWIDIGGPALVRAAAKNHAAVCVLSRPEHYEPFLAEWRRLGGTTGATRRRLAAEAFALTAAYDAEVAACLAGAETLPPVGVAWGIRGATLRYGENPHQEAALYLAPGQPAPWGPFRVLGGRALSYNNLLDVQAALALLRDLPADRTACVILKHQIPCGAALRDEPAAAYRRALAGDPVSAFGGVVGFNRPLTPAALAAMQEGGQFVEVVVAPAIPAALARTAAGRKGWRNTRFVAVPAPQPPSLEVRAVEGGFLVQTPDTEDAGGWEVVTERRPTPAETRDLELAAAVVKHVRSNAVVLVREQQLVGVGAGQTSRVDAVHVALGKAGKRARGAVLASDAFFPFPDGVEAAARGGVTAVLAPKGSRRDAEVAAAAARLGVALVFTDRRHFRH